MKVEIVYVHLSRFNTSYAILFPLKMITVLYTIMLHVVSQFIYFSKFTKLPSRVYVSIALLPRWFIDTFLYLRLKLFIMKILCDDPPLKTIEFESGIQILEAMWKKCFTLWLYVYWNPKESCLSSTEFKGYPLFTSSSLMSVDYFM